MVPQRTGHNPDGRHRFYSLAAGVRLVALGGRESADTVPKRQLQWRHRNYKDLAASSRKAVPSLVIRNFKRTPGAREDGGLPSKMR
jgi:hypothetical protein